MTKSRFRITRLLGFLSDLGGAGLTASWLLAFALGAWAWLSTQISVPMAALATLVAAAALTWLFVAIGIILRRLEAKDAGENRDTTTPSLVLHTDKEIAAFVTRVADEGLRATKRLEGEVRELQKEKESWDLERVSLLRTRDSALQSVETYREMYLETKEEWLAAAEAITAVRNAVRDVPRYVPLLGTGPVPYPGHRDVDDSPAAKVLRVTQALSEYDSKRPTATPAVASGAFSTFLSKLMSEMPRPRIAPPLPAEPKDE